MASKQNRRRRQPAAAASGKRRRIVHKFGEDDYVDYKDVALLRKFMSDRGKIRARRMTGLSPKRQREVATAIRNAREMALLPYLPAQRHER